MYKHRVKIPVVVDGDQTATTRFICLDVEADNVGTAVMTAQLALQDLLDAALIDAEE